MKIGILIVTPSFSPDIGGIASHLDDLCSVLEKKGYLAYIATCQPIINNRKDKYFEKNKSFYVFRMPLLGWKRFIFTGRLRFIYENILLLFPCLYFLIFKNKEVKVIHSQSFASSFLVYVLGKIFKKKIYLSTHNIFKYNDRKLSNRVIRRVLNKYNHIFCVSKESANELVEIGVNAKRISVYTHWVNNKIFIKQDQGKCRQVLGLKQVFTVVYVGRLEHSKGIDIMIDLIKNLKDVFFIIIGDGNKYRELFELANTCANLLLIRDLENSKIPQYLCASDILVIPTVEKEGFGRFIIEAFSCGVSVIGTNIGRIPEIVSPEVGIIVSQSFRSNIEKALRELKDDKEKLFKLSATARTYAEKYYSSHNADIFLKKYEE